MVSQMVSERRRFRRADLELPVTITLLGDDDQHGESLTCQLRNVSLAGLYCLITGPTSLKHDDRILCSLTVPRDRTRTFPFTRLHSRGWVLRVEPVHAGRRSGDTAPPGQQVFGMAVAFAPDATALATFE